MNAPRKNALEWAVFVASCALVLATVGFLAYDALTHKPSPPDVIVELGEPRPHGEGFAVPVRAVNRGNQTAEAVRIEVTLPRGPEAASEIAQLEIELLPRRGYREGWVIFADDPRGKELGARVLGYGLP